MPARLPTALMPASGESQGNFPGQAMLAAVKLRVTRSSES